MKIKLTCSSCGTQYPLPDYTKEGEAKEIEAMRVVSDPFSDGKQVWFWSEKENCFFLNLSCKRELDLIFLRSGQSITSTGDIQMEDVHMKWVCENCGKEMEIREKLPCLVNRETKIQLARMGQQPTKKGVKSRKSHLQTSLKMIE